MPFDDDECEHGAKGFCRTCCAIHEGKLSKEADAEMRRKAQHSGARFAGDMSDEEYEGDHHC